MLFSAWPAHLAGTPQVCAAHVGVFGFSAGVVADYVEALEATFGEPLDASTSFIGNSDFGETEVGVDEEVQVGWRVVVETPDGAPPATRMLANRRPWSIGWTIVPTNSMFRSVSSGVSSVW